MLDVVGVSFLFIPYILIYINASSHFSVTSFCELVNSLLQQAEDPAQDLNHVAEGVLEVSHSPQFLLRRVLSILGLNCLNKLETYQKSLNETSVLFTFLYPACETPQISPEAHTF